MSAQPNNSYKPLTGNEEELGTVVSSVQPTPLESGSLNEAVATKMPELTPEQQQQVLMMLLANPNALVAAAALAQGQLPQAAQPQPGVFAQSDNTSAGPALATAAGGLPPGSNPKRVESPALCNKDHKMVLCDYMTAYQFAKIHPVGIRASLFAEGQKSRKLMTCGNCLFAIQPEERVFLCELCTMDEEVGTTIYCETCVATGMHISAGQQWSSGLCGFCEHPSSFVDANVCFPCKMAALDTWANTRNDGKIPGDGDRCKNAACATFLCVVYDPWMLGTMGALIASHQAKTAAVLNNIKPPGDCAGFWTAYFCRSCVVARTHRQWQTRHAEFGEPTGCLFNLRGKPAHRPERVTYSQIPAFAAPTSETMGAPSKPAPPLPQ